MSTWGMAAWISIWIGGTATFFFVGGKHIFYPYSSYPKQTVYKAYPDYANGSVFFYEKEVPNMIRDL